MKNPVCPNCSTTISFYQVLKELTPFTVTCQLCNHQLTLAFRWRITLWLEFAALTAFSYFSNGFSAAVRYVAGHPFSTVGSLITLGIVVAFVTWNSVQYELPPKERG